MAPIRSRILGALWGGVIGDALGVPVEFVDRTSLAADPVRGMRGYGTWNQPPGTWSDDTSMTVATVSVLMEHGFDEIQLLDAWNDWREKGKWTAHGHRFDIGGVTNSALADWARHRDPERCGRTDKASNGNGSLMRAMPISLWQNVKNMKEIARDASALTHGHEISLACCQWHAELVQRILAGMSWADACDAATAIVAGAHPDALLALDLDMTSRPRSSVKSTGYVVDTLDAAVWCIWQALAINGSDRDRFEHAVLTAVNLGGDTDTVGTVTGGLAGLLWGIHAVPTCWIVECARHEWLQKMFDVFADMTAPGAA